MTANDNGDDNNSPPNITNSQIEEKLVRDDITNELYMSLSSTIVLKRKKEMLYVPLDFENGLTIDALVDSEAYVSAIAQKELDRTKQPTPSKILKIDDPPNFQIQVASGQSEKPTATATRKFDIWAHIFAEHFVLMKSLTGFFLGLHFMRHNSVVIDTTHGLIHFQIWQCKSKVHWVKQVLNLKRFFFTIAKQYHSWQRKQSQHLFTNNRNGIQQGPWLQWKDLQKPRVS